MKEICKKSIVILVIVIITSMNFSLAVTQSEIDSQKNKQSENQQKINEAEEARKKLEAQKSETQKEVENLATQINSYEEQIDDLDYQIDNANKKIEESEAKIKEAEEEYDKKNDILQKRVVALYEAGETSYLDVLLNSKSITDFISTYYIVSEIAQHDMELLKTIQKQKEEIENSKKELENSKNELTQAKTSKENVNNELKNKKSQKDAKVAQLTSEEKEVEKQIQELQAANKQLANQIKEAERKYAEQLKELENNSSGNSGNNSGNSGGSGNSGNTSGSGFFMRPVSSGSISARAYYSSGKFHGALDYAVSPGTPIYAAADGVVMVTANLAGSYGTHVVIRHANGLQTYYAHGTYGSISVNPGQIVKKGQQIMKSGNTGNSQGPHLHFEVRKSPYTYNGYATGYGQDSRVNPEAYM